MLKLGSRNLSMGNKKLFLAAALFLAFSIGFESNSYADIPISNQTQLEAIGNDATSLSGSYVLT